jgi:hypothetical protein
LRGVSHGIDEPEAWAAGAKARSNAVIARKKLKRRRLSRAEAEK